MTTYRTSSGERLAKSVIDNRVKEAKRAVIQEQFDDSGYNFCVECLRSDRRLTCAHIESVNDCQRNGYTEKAYDTKNIKILCMECHQIFDKNNVQSAKI